MICLICHLSKAPLKMNSATYKQSSKTDRGAAISMWMNFILDLNSPSLGVKIDDPNKARNWSFHPGNFGMFLPWNGVSVCAVHLKVEVWGHAIYYSYMQYWYVYKMSITMHYYIHHIYIVSSRLHKTHIHIQLLYKKHIYIYICIYIYSYIYIDMIAPLHTGFPAKETLRFDPGGTLPGQGTPSE